MEDSKTLENYIMEIIVNSGDAKSSAVESIRAARLNDIDLAELKIKNAEKAMLKAHKNQTGLLTMEANNKDIEISILLIHAQDHLMNAITFIDLAKEFVELYKKINN